MNARQRKQFLLASGFTFHANVRHGFMYHDSYGQRFLLARRPAGRNMQNFEADVRRLIRNRGEVTLSAIKPLAHKPFESLKKPVATAAAAAAAVPNTPTQASVESQKTRDKVRRFTSVQRQIIFDRIIALHNEGLTPAGITIALQREGHRMSNGDDIEFAWVSVAVSRLKSGGVLQVRPYASSARMAEPAPAPAAQPEPTPAPIPEVVAAPAKVTNLPDAVQYILLDASIGDTKKIAMIKAWAGL